ncbi:hypothetical protein [Raoultella sp. YJ]|uniref:hypothetical protein n=1 Tax=Raoultella sp. YJ TaxID=1850565 RepID=UPI000A18BEEA|nr:hypothetical protein [Raoultella sp. YJ]
MPGATADNAVARRCAFYADDLSGGPPSAEVKIKIKKLAQFYFVTDAGRYEEDGHLNLLLRIRVLKNSSYQHISGVLAGIFMSRDGKIY